eukprot:TRINITY_DN12226_c0_g1_i1.p1 TRINITY_DN12226_c0_g1~~TRINITY_DN12226_c0_g1_i1.p1  ORF type:complete len:434 (+),score=152.25 TRINITY_DN12226_c0_g1_i1:42-1343(+)
MSKEAVVTLLDCSDFMRNTDFYPSRMESQYQSAFSLISKKIDSHREAGVAIISNSDFGKVIYPVSNNLTYLFAALKTVVFDNDYSFTNALRKSILVLRNRPDETQKKRIIIFVGSPMYEEVEKYEELAVEMKEENIAVDIILFSHFDQNLPICEKIMDITKPEDTEIESSFIILREPRKAPMVDQIRHAFVSNGQVAAIDPNIAAAIEASRNDIPAGWGGFPDGMTEDEMIQMAIQRSLADQEPPNVEQDLGNDQIESNASENDEEALVEAENQLLQRGFNVHEMVAYELETLLCNDDISDAERLYIVQLLSMMENETDNTNEEEEEELNLDDLAVLSLDELQELFMNPDLTEEERTNIAIAISMRDEESTHEEEEQNQDQQDQQTSQDSVIQSQNDDELITNLQELGFDMDDPDIREQLEQLRKTREEQNKK